MRLACGETSPSANPLLAAAGAVGPVTASCFAAAPLPSPVTLPACICESGEVQTAVKGLDTLQDHTQRHVQAGRATEPIGRSSHALLAHQLEQ